MDYPRIVNNLLVLYDPMMFWRCTRCKITSYDTDDLRGQSVIEEPEGPPEEPAVALAPEPTLKRKKKTIKGGLAEIAKRASVNILDYKEGKG
jgi:hypothetical protein